MMWIIRAFFMTYVICHGFGCPCLLDHIQDEFCSSSLVIRGKIFKMNDLQQGPDTTAYKIDIMEVFKDSEKTNIKAGDVIEAVTYEGVCGGSLNLDVELLIMGDLEDTKKMTLELCSYIKPVRSLTKFQLKRLRGSYACECRVWNWRPQENVKGCHLNVFPYDANCLHKYGQCVLGKDKTCIWEVEETKGCHIEIY